MLENKCSSIFSDVFMNPYLIERILIGIYLVIFVIGIIGNIMTIIIIKYNKHLRTPTNFYLLNLSVSDLMILMCNLPMEMIEIHYRQWPLHISFCRLRNISAEFFTCSSILTILAFTCERYFAIVHPIHFHQLSHFRRAKNMILIIWFLSLVFSIPFGFTYEISSITFRNTLNTTDETIYEQYQCRSCVPKKNLEKYLSISMILTSLVFFYFPMFIIGTIYLYIGKALRRMNKYENPLDHELSLTSLSSYSNYGKKVISRPTSSQTSLCYKDLGPDSKQTNKHIGSYSWLKTRARCQARKVVVKTLVAVVIAFFVCYAPLYLQRFLLAIMTLNTKLNADSQAFSKIMAYLYFISGTTFYFGSVINPILYNVVSNKYRRAFRDLFRCRLTYNVKAPNRNQRKFFQTNQQFNHNFMNYLNQHRPQQQQHPQQQQQQQQHRKLYNSNLSLNQNLELEHNRYHLNNNIHHPQQPASSNSSAITLPISPPENRDKYKSKRFSLRKHILRRQQPTGNVPWLTKKNRT